MAELTNREALGLLRCVRGCLVAGLIACLVAACGGDDDGAVPTNTGAACTAVSQCYPGVKDGTLSGDAECLDVPGGYCTHQCTADTDCCAADGECPYHYAQVCAPFTSMPAKRCFLSCEDADLKKANVTDADAYCHTYASSAFNCRSTGGGAENRKVCLP